MTDQLFALMVFMHQPDSWKEKVYESKYNQSIIRSTEKNRLNDNQTIYKGVKASWYGEAICRGRKFCKTASGREFKPAENTCACLSGHPFGTRFLVTYGNRSVVVTCTDRGGFAPLGRFLDLSSGAFEQLAPLSRGILTVDVKKLDK